MIKMSIIYLSIDIINLGMVITIVSITGSNIATAITAHIILVAFFFIKIFHLHKYFIMNIYYLHYSV